MRFRICDQESQWLWHLKESEGLRDFTKSEEKSNLDLECKVRWYLGRSDGFG